MRLDRVDERNYYLREAAEQGWSSRLLERSIKSGYCRRVENRFYRMDLRALQARFSHIL